MNAPSPAELWPFFAELAAVAARETLPRFRAGIAVDNKAQGGAFDPVTAADRAAEAALRAAIHARYPQHGVIGEEPADQPGVGAWTWIIDPIDGTRSYVSGMPTWGTLIGLLEDGVPRYGMMSHPTSASISSAATVARNSYATRAGLASRHAPPTCSTMPPCSRPRRRCSPREPKPRRSGGCPRVRA